MPDTVSHVHRLERVPLPPLAKRGDDAVSVSVRVVKCRSGFELHCEKLLAGKIGSGKLESGVVRLLSRRRLPVEAAIDGDPQTEVVVEVVVAWSPLPGTLVQELIEDHLRVATLIVDLLNEQLSEFGQ